MSSSGSVMRGIRVVYLKELKDSLRDRRALLTALLPALLMPLFMIFMFNSVADTLDSAEDLEVQVIGEEFAPDLLAFLRTQDVNLVPYDGDPKEDIQAGDIEVVLEISPDYAEDFTASTPATIYIHSDNSLDRSDVAADRLRNLIRGYGASIGSMRLLVRGINPAVSAAVQIENKDYSTDASRAAQILSGMQMFILMAAFFGSAPSAIDTTAGERERNSLEPLLVHPLSSAKIILGKYFAVCSFGLLATILTVVVSGTALESMSSLEALGIDPRLSGPMQLSVISLMAPVIFLAAGMQMLLALFAKTFKEAQSYTGIVMILPIFVVIPSMTGMVNEEPWMFFVPLLGQQQLVDRILRGDDLEWLSLLFATGVTLALAAVLLMALMRILRSERVVYGG